jgi:putative peptidoglycan lipid II flippase
MGRRPDRGIGRAAVLITALTAASSLLGFGRDVAIAAVFGAGPEIDAYLVAQGLMNIVLGLLAGAMAKAAVPVFARQHAGLATTLSVTCSVTLVGLGVAAIVMWILVTPVVAVLAPGFDGEQAVLARTLTRIVLVATVLIAGTNLLAAAAQAHRRFFWSSVQGLPFNLVMIVAAVGFGPRYGVVALAVGFVAGSAVRLACQLVPLRQLALRLRPRFALRDPGFREIARMVPALLVGSAIGNVNTLVDRAVGSLSGDGTIAALSYAWRLVSLGETLLVVSLVTALYPAFGAAARRPDDLARLVERGLTTIIVALAPVIAILLAAGPLVVTVVYRHGRFDAADAALTSSALLWYTPALLALGCRELVVRASYAAGDARMPMLVALAAMTVNVAGDLTLGLRYGVPGLAASTTLSLLLAAAANAWLLHRRHAPLDLRRLAGVLLRTAAAAALAGTAGAVMLRLGPDATGWTAVLLLAAASATVVAVFVAVLQVIRAPERALIHELVRAVRR